MTRTPREQWLGVLTVLVLWVASNGLAYVLCQHSIAIRHSWMWTGTAIFLAALFVRAVLDVAWRRFRPAVSPPSA